MSQRISELRHPSEPGPLRLKFYQWRRDARPVRFLYLPLLIAVLPVALLFRALSRLVPMRQRETNVLVLHFAGVGDTLLLTPALSALHRHYRNARVDLITRHEYVKKAFQNHPGIQSIELLPSYSDAWFGPKLETESTPTLLLLTLWYYPELILRNCFRRYAVGINFALSDFDRARGNALLYCLNPAVRIGSRDRHDSLLTQTAQVDYAHTHRANAYLDYLRPLNINGRVDGYEFPITALDSLKVEKALNVAGIPAAKDLVAIHPGGKVHINSRRWPSDYFIRVGKYLTESGSFHLIVTGDDEDRELCDEIARSIGKGATSFAGQLSIPENAALLSRCALSITNDTATLHLAEAMQVPRVISIFGPTDPKLLVPRNDRHLVFRSQLPCSPCMGSIIDAKSERCPREIKEECLWLVTPEEVIAALREQYERPALRAVNS